MDLQKDIHAIISPYLTQSNHPPPFSRNELVVIALAVHPQDRLTALEIFSWVCTTFPFYTALGDKAVWKYLDGDDDTSSQSGPQDNLSPDTTFSGFMRTLYAWDVPVIEVEGDEGDEDEDGGAEWEGKERWTVDPGEARWYLRSRLYSTRTSGSGGVFPFLQLPPEIRNSIYTLVLGFPSSGIQINRHDEDRSGTLFASTRDFNRPFAFSRWRRKDKRLHIGRLSSILSLLLANRQIHSETSLLFYNINTFYFTSASHLLDILQRIPTHLRDHIQHIAFDYIPRLLESLYMKRAFRILAVMKSLRTLRIFIDGREWLKVFWFRHKIPPSKMLEFELAHGITEVVDVIVEGKRVPRDVLEQIRAPSKGGEIGGASRGDECWEDCGSDLETVVPLHILEDIDETAVSLGKPVRDEQLRVSR